MNQPPTPILMYHQVTPRPIPALRNLAVTPRTFAIQMKALHLARYQPITLDQLLANRLGRLALPPRPVIITFDDGYQDVVDYAVPILLMYRFTAVIFLVAEMMGKMSGWLQQEYAVDVPIMDWNSARRLESAGLRCEAHSLTHPQLTDLPLDLCMREINDSRRRIGEELGRDIRHFAYPYGLYNDRVRALVAEAGYSTACSVNIGRSSVRDDLLALRRVHVHGTETLAGFLLRLRTGGSIRDAARRTMPVTYARLRQVKHRLQPGS